MFVGSHLDCSRRHSHLGRNLAVRHTEPAGRPVLGPGTAGIEIDRIRHRIVDTVDLAGKFVRLE